MAQRDRIKIQSALKSKGFIEEKGRDHIYYFLSNHKTIFTKISLGSGYKTYGKELLSQMSKKLKISTKELLGLIDCSLKSEHYLEILRQKKII